MAPALRASPDDEEGFDDAAEDLLVEVAEPFAKAPAMPTSSGRYHPAIVLDDDELAPELASLDLNSPEIKKLTEVNFDSCIPTNTGLR
jgi:hypothetical protein